MMPFAKHGMNENVLFRVSFLIVILLAALARFYGLAAHGISYVDEAIYISLAKDWYFNHNFINPWSKPGYQLLSCFGVFFFGYRDFTLPYLNSLLDLVSIVFLFLIGTQMRMRRTFILSAMIIYAFLPFILSYYILALPNLPSITFFLASFYVFLVYFNSPRRPASLLFLTGVLIAFAGNVHPTLLCSAIFYGIALIVMSFWNSRTLFGLGAYCFGYASVFAGIALFMAKGWNGFFPMLIKMGKIIIHHRDGATGGYQGSFLSKISYAFGLAPHLFTPFFVMLFLAIMAVFIILKFKPQLPEAHFNVKRVLLILLWGCVINYLLINLITALAWLPRLSAPVVPLIILGFMALADRLACRFPDERAIGFKLLVLVVMIALANCMQGWGGITKQPPSPSRQLVDVLHDKVDDQNRLLIMPVLSRVRLFEGVYFNENHLYALQKPWKPEMDLLKKYNIRYVAVFKEQILRDVAQERILPADFVKKTAEFSSIYEGLNSMGARCLLNNAQISVFEVPVQNIVCAAYQPSPKGPFFNLGFPKPSQRMTSVFYSVDME